MVAAAVRNGEDTRENKTEQCCTSEGFDGTGSVAGNAADADSDDDVTDRAANGADEDDGHEGEQPESHKLVVVEESCRDREGHEPVDDECDDPATKRRQWKSVGHVDHSNLWPLVSMISVYVEKNTDNTSADALSGYSMNP